MIDTGKHYDGNGSGILRLNTNATQAFDFTYQGFIDPIPLSNNASLTARWTKPGRTLELLVPFYSPNKPVIVDPKHLSKCQVDVSLRGRVITVPAKAATQSVPTTPPAVESAGKATKYSLRVQVIKGGYACSDCPSGGVPFFSTLPPGSHADEPEETPVGEDGPPELADKYWSGRGSGVLWLDTNKFLDFRFTYNSCIDPVPLSKIATDSLAARWTKPDRTLEVLVPFYSPNKPIDFATKHLTKCQVDVSSHGRIITVPATAAVQPAPTAAPAGTKALMTLTGKGIQMYACKAQPTGPAWTFVAPQAKLLDDHGAEVGTHSAGPTWTLKDGSSVKGQLITSTPSPDPNAIPWLLLKSVPASGTGSLSAVQYIRRSNTVGGKAPATGCDATHPEAASAQVQYKAVYTFYTAAK
jgi:hypothetical protein